MQPVRFADGRMLRYFELPDRAGQPFPLEKYQRLRSLVIFFGHGGCEQCAALLRDYAAHAAAIRGEGAEPVAVFDTPSAPDVVMPVLVDRAGSAAQAQELRVPALLVADRYGEVYAAWEGSTAHDLPSGEEVISWVVSIERLCEECTISEWSVHGREDE